MVHYLPLLRHRIGIGMRATPGLVTIILAACAALAGLYWWQASRPVNVVDALSDRMSCVSYAPFHQENHTPFDPTLLIGADHIDADLAKLSQRFDCVRIYSVMMGLHETKFPAFRSPMPMSGNSGSSTRNWPTPCPS